MENLTGGTPPARPLPCVVPCKLYFLKVKICDISIKLVTINPIKAIFLMFLNLSHNIGKKKPNGTNKSIFKQALTKSETISKNGITFTAKSIFRDAILGKPTSAKTAVK